MTVGPRSFAAVLPRGPRVETTTTPEESSVRPAPCGYRRHGARGFGTLRSPRSQPATQPAWSSASPFVFGVLPAVRGSGRCTRKAALDRRQSPDVSIGTRLPLGCGGSLHPDSSAPRYVAIHALRFFYISPRKGKFQRSDGQVKIESGTQVASQDLGWRIAMPLVLIRATAYLSWHSALADVPKRCLGSPAIVATVGLDRGFLIDAKPKHATSTTSEWGIG